MKRDSNGKRGSRWSTGGTYIRVVDGGIVAGYWALLTLLDSAHSNKPSGGQASARKSYSLREQSRVFVIAVRSPSSWLSVNVFTL